MFFPRAALQRASQSSPAPTQQVLALFCDDAVAGDRDIARNNTKNPCLQRACFPPGETDREQNTRQLHGVLDENQCYMRKT